MSDVLEKARKLLALSGSENENEARNAAALCCKLMRDNNLQIVSAASAKKAAERRAPQPSYDPFEEALRWATSTRNTERSSRPEQRQKPPPPKRKPKLVGKRGRARRAGNCVVCGEAYRQGDDVVTGADATQVAHGDCGTEG
jgi:hypothetical protein